jgi:hypothetical protein
MLLRNTYNEFIKIVSKPRSYLGFGALTILISIIIFAMKMDGETIVSFITASFEQTLSFNGKIVNGNLIAFIDNNGGQSDGYTKDILNLGNLKQKIEFCLKFIAGEKSDISIFEGEN